MRREPHHLVLALVDGESEPAAVNVEVLPREWKADSSRNISSRVLPSSSMAPLTDEPLADAVGGEDGRRCAWSGEERGGGVRLVVLGEDNFRPGTPSCEDMISPQAVLSRAGSS